MTGDGPRHRGRGRVARPPFRGTILPSGPITITLAVFSIGLIGGGVRELVKGHLLGLVILAVGLAFPVYLVRYFRLPVIRQPRDE